MVLDKVAIIRNQLDCGTSQALALPYNHDIEFQQTPFTSFQPITIDYLRSVIIKCPPKSCEFDPIHHSDPYITSSGVFGYSTPNHDQYH